MIPIESLNEESKSREVMYTSHGCREFGYITSWNARFIFVRYHLKIYDDGKRQFRTGQTSESTRPEDLLFTHAEIGD